jgi:hypothetical protein
MKNLKEIVKEWLVENGYDGLCLPEQECGCPLRALMPCSEPSDQCQAGHKVMRDDGDWIIVVGKKAFEERSCDVRAIASADVRRCLHYEEK